MVVRLERRNRGSLKYSSSPPKEESKVDPLQIRTVCVPLYNFCPLQALFYFDFFKVQILDG